MGGGAFLALGARSTRLGTAFVSSVSGAAGGTAAKSARSETWDDGLWAGVSEVLLHGALPGALGGAVSGFAFHNAPTTLLLEASGRALVHGTAAAINQRA